MRRVLAVSCLLLTLAACGKGNSKVADQGHTLAPQSAVFFSGSVLFFSIGGVLITDAPGACDTITKAGPANPCNGSSGSPLQGSSLAANSTTLTILALPAGQGTFNVIDPNAGRDGGSSSIPSGVFFGFSKSENGQVTFSDTGVSGTVKFDHFESGKGASGSYDVAMQSGAHLSGDFNANDCPALDQQISSSTSSQRSCSASSTGSGCMGSCSCDGHTVKASCSGPTDGGSGDWTCTCTDASGASSTCTEPRPSSSVLAACEQKTGCCPLTF